MDIKITKTTKFWLYPVSDENFNYFMKYRGNYVTFFEKTNVAPQDIVIVYCKGIKNKGFGALIQISSDTVQNITNKISIFKNNNLNKYRATVSIRKNFTPLIKLKDVINGLKIDDSGFKSVQHFSSRYLKIENGVIQLQNYGQQLTNKLIEIQLKEEEKSNKAIKKQEKSSDDDQSENESSIDDNQSENESSTDDSGSDQSENESSSDDSDSDQSENNNRGFIPIMVIPCKNLKIEDMDKENRGETFINHYQKCNQCEVTNNNNRELCSIIGKAKIEFFELKTEKHAFFNPPLDCYFAMEKYEVLGATQFPYIRIVYINNKHQLYDKCILITWCE